MMYIVVVMAATAVEVALPETPTASAALVEEPAAAEAVEVRVEPVMLPALAATMTLEEMDSAAVTGQ